MSGSDKKILALTALISSMNFPKETLEATLSTFILMKFGFDDRQAVQFLGNLQERSESND